MEMDYYLIFHILFFLGEGERSCPNPHRYQGLTVLVYHQLHSTWGGGVGSMSNRESL